MKFVNTDIVFQEVPDEVSLAINISNCPCHCPGCHSSYLWNDIGETLDEEALDRIIAECESSITCILFMGGDAEPDEVDRLAQYIHKAHVGLKVAWYTGRTVLSRQVDRNNFDYIKIGPYIKHLGPLNSRTTNQRMYRVADGEMIDITSRFWKK